MESAAVVSPAARRWKPYVAAAIVAAVAMAAAWQLTAPRHAAPGMATAATYTVVPLDMDVAIDKVGEMQAVNNTDITCDVEGSTTIQTLVKEGTHVKKGDVLVTLDSSAIKEKIDDTQLDLQKAQNDLTTAQEMKSIQETTNATNLEAAQVAFTLAQLDLKQYTEGSYPQTVASAESDKDMAYVNLHNVEDKLGQTKQLMSHGYVTNTSVKDDEITVEQARAAANKSATALSVLQNFTHQMDLASKQNTLAQAQARVERTRRENAANLAQRTGDVEGKQQALALLKRRAEHYQEQFDACTIKAPDEGLVVYSSSNDRNQQAPIQEGAQVREHQPLLALPDTSSMKAVIRVQEAQVSRLQKGLKAKVQIVGYPGDYNATLSKISVLADNSQRWFNPDLKEYPVDLTLDEPLPGLKPGMGCSANVFIDRAYDISAVPLTALYSAGQDTYVFVRGATEVTPRKVKIGRTNETNAEILNGGVKNNEQVLILESGQGQDLLEKAGISSGPATRPSDDADATERERHKKM